MKDKIVKLKDIKISNNFIKHPPSDKKMKNKWKYYRKNGKLKEDIQVDNRRSSCRWVYKLFNSRSGWNKKS